MPRSAQLAIYGALFLDLLGFGMIIPDFQLRAEAMGAHGWLIGLMLASSFLIQAIVSPTWGKIGDRVGRGPILVLCQCISASAAFVYALPGCIAILLISRLLSGLGGANVVLAQSIVASGSPDDRRVEALGKLGAAVSCGLMLGPALGGLIENRLGSTMVGIIAGTCSALAAILLAVLTPRNRNPAPLATVSNSGRQLLRAFPNVRRLFAIAAVAWFSLAMLEGTFGRLIERTMNFHQLQFGIVFSFESLVGLVVQGLLVGRLASRITESKLLRAAYLSQGVGLGLTPFCSRLPYAGAWLALLLVASGIYAAGSGVAGPAISAYCSKEVSPSRHGEMFGLLQSARSVGFIIGPILGGAIFDWWPPGPYILAAMTCAAASTLVPSKRRNA